MVRIDGGTALPSDLGSSSVHSTFIDLERTADLRARHLPRK